MGRQGAFSLHGLGRGRARRWLTVVSAGALLAPVLVVLPARAAPTNPSGAVNPQERSVAVSGVPGRARPAVESDTAALGKVPAPVWIASPTHDRASQPARS